METLTKKMTAKQALAKSRKLFGKYADIVDRGEDSDCCGQFRVGCIVMGCFSVMGHGSSWEDAFAHYEQRMSERADDSSESERNDFTQGAE